MPGSNNNFNPAVNPPVDTDFSSNAQRRAYNSTTDDLLDRIRTAVESMSSTPTTPSEPKKDIHIVRQWVVLSVIGHGSVKTAYADVVYQENSNVLEAIGFILYGKFLPTTILNNQGFDIIDFQRTPPLLLYITGRIDSQAPSNVHLLGLIGNITFDEEEGEYIIPFNTARADTHTLVLELEDMNVFFVEIVVLPETILNEDPSQNYYSIIYDDGHESGAVERKYYLDSMTGIPIINRQRLELDALECMTEIQVTAQPGIILEYTIKATFNK